jgi:AcrR family transcriptional regulator
MDKPARRSSRKQKPDPSAAALARTVALLWAEKEGPSRGPKPSLSTERIALAGIAIADAEGIAAVSMQRVAAAFGFTTMSLYRYVPGKTELLALMFEIGLGAPPAHTVAGGWRAQLLDWARRMSVIIHRHPWSLDLLNRLRVTGPNELGWMECAVRALDGTGLTGSEKLDAIFTLIGHVRVTAQYTVAPSRAEGGLSPLQWNEAVAGVLQKHAAAYPALIAAVSDGAFGTTPSDGLDTGLNRILDGIAVRIAQSVKQTKSTP